MKIHEKLFCLDLRLFDGGEGGDGAAAGEAQDSHSAAGDGKRANPLADIVYGKQPASEVLEDAQAAAEQGTSDNTEVKDKNAAFEKLIRDEYKEQFAARTQAIIDKRFKESKALEAQINESKPILDMLAQKYGVSDGDLKKLAEAIEEDDSYYADEAAQRGMTVEQLKQMKKMERENAELKRSVLETQRREEAEKVYGEWLQQAESMKEIYPSFDLGTECQDSRFVDLLKNNIDMRTAYEVLHRDEILSGAMQYTAQKVSQQLVNGIKAKGNRPTENGISTQSAAVVKSDVNALTRKDRDEIERRVMRGERISF